MVKKRERLLASIPLQSLFPRFEIQSSAPALVDRDGSCGSGKHPCNDIGKADQCCDNQSYCYISKDGSPKCCPIGSNCVSDANCSSDSYLCSQTTTTTQGNTVAGVTLASSPSSSVRCCARSCPQTSRYLCARDLGGGCCPYDSECRPGGQCVGTVTAATSSPSLSAILTPVTSSGCTTSQHRCSDGGGCCDNGQDCTQVDGAGYCALAAPTASNITVSDHGGGGGPDLSDGAKIGIGISTVLGAGLLIGVLTWLCIHRRRAHRGRRSSRLSGSGALGSNRRGQEMTALSGTAPSSVQDGTRIHATDGTRSMVTLDLDIDGWHESTPASGVSRAVNCQQQGSGGVVASAKMASGNELVDTRPQHHSGQSSRNMASRLHNTHGLVELPGSEPPQ